MAKGGKRPGAGRKKGVTNRPQIRSYFTDKEIGDLVVQLKERAKTDSTILKFLGEQVFGKAPQPLTDDDGNAIAIAGFAFITNEDNNAGNPADS
jgi:hypothetical protein